MVANTKIYNSEYTCYPDSVAETSNDNNNNNTELKIVDNIGHERATAFPESKLQHYANFWSVSVLASGLFTWLCPFLAVVVTAAWTFGQPSVYVNRPQFCKNVVSQFHPASVLAGRYMPQKYIWTILIVLHYPVRLILPRMIARYYFKVNGNRHFTNTKMCIPYIRVRTVQWEGFLEAIGLVLLSIVDLDTNSGVHEFAFILWAVGFMSFLLNDTYFCYITQIYKKARKHKACMILKLFIFITTLSLCFVNFGIYLTYKMFCNQTLYEWFVSTEYVVVALNLAYHLTIILEFGKVNLVFSGDFTRQNLGNYRIDDQKWNPL